MLNKFFIIIVVLLSLFVGENASAKNNFWIDITYDNQKIKNGLCSATELDLSDWELESLGLVTDAIVYQTQAHCFEPRYFSSISGYVTPIGYSLHQNRKRITTLTKKQWVFTDPLKGERVCDGKIVKTEPERFDCRTDRVLIVLSGADQIDLPAYGKWAPAEVSLGESLVYKGLVSRHETKFGKNKVIKKFPNQSCERYMGPIPGFLKKQVEGKNALIPVTCPAIVGGSGGRVSRSDGKIVGTISLVYHREGRFVFSLMTPVLKPRKSLPDSPVLTAALEQK